MSFIGIMYCKHLPKMIASVRPSVPSRPVRPVPVRPSGPSRPLFSKHLGFPYYVELSDLCLLSELCTESSAKKCCVCPSVPSGPSRPSFFKHLGFPHYV